MRLNQHSPVLASRFLMRWISSLYCVLFFKLHWIYLICFLSYTVFNREKTVCFHSAAILISLALTLKKFSWNGRVELSIWVVSLQPHWVMMKTCVIRSVILLKGRILLCVISSWLVVKSGRGYWLLNAAICMVAKHGESNHKALVELDSLWPSEAIWRRKSGSTLAHIMACCLTAPSHYLNQCWLFVSEVNWK